jgi:hypothetical protein
VIPFPRPHDDPPRDRRAWGRLVAFLLLVAVIVFATWFAVGCSSNRFVPELPHPTMARIRELAIAPAPADSLGTLTLVVTPRAVLAGGAVHLRCLIPLTAHADAVGLGLAGVRSHAGPVDGLEADLVVDGVPCGDWTAYCSIARGAAIVARAEQPLTAHGTCNEGGF